MLIQSDYLHKAFDPYELKRTIDRIARHLEIFSAHTEFDAIAFRGVSGAAIAFPLSYKMGLPLLCIRKESVNTHCLFNVEGNINAQRYVVVDDRIDTGETLRAIARQIKFHCGKTAKCVGVYLYDQEDLPIKCDYVGGVEVPRIDVVMNNRYVGV